MIHFYKQKPNILYDFLKHEWCYNFEALLTSFIVIPSKINEAALLHQAF